MVRIQNRHLYIQFKAYRDRVSRECKEMSFDESVIESELWHGTTAAAGAAICGTEFNRTFAGRVFHCHHMLYFIHKHTCARTHT